jgi:peptidoglycan hydrolase-like protein with peptidoglycan-binding domain
MGKFNARLFGTAFSVAVLGAGLAMLTAAPANAAASCTRAVTITGVSGTHAVVPGTGGGTSTNPGECHLTEGSSGAAVTAMQRGLNSCYGAGITADGQFGPKTRSAVIAVQKRIGVTADGSFGPKTRGAMNWMAFNNSGPVGCRYFPNA